MTSTATRAESVERPRMQLHEVFVTVLLIVAAAAASWSSYQATRWNGEQAQAAGRTSAIRIEAARVDNLAAAQTQVDVATFIAWTGADGRGDEAMAQFYVARFRTEFAVAFQAWVATDPLTNPDAPSTPFAMEEYRVAAGDEAARLDERAEGSGAAVALNIQRSSNYVLTVVLYTIALLFAGVAAKMGNRRLRTAVVAAGYVLFLVALGWVVTLPVSVAI